MPDRTGQRHRYRLPASKATAPETIVLVNGLADEKESWGYQTPDLLAAGYRVLTFDNRGVGKSTMPPGPYTTRRFAQDTKGLVDHLGLMGFHMVGTSMGGMIAQEYAIAYGADLKSVTLSSHLRGARSVLWPDVRAVGGHGAGDGCRHGHARRHPVGASPARSSRRVPRSWRSSRQRWR